LHCRAQTNKAPGKNINSKCDASLFNNDNDDDKNNDDDYADVENNDDDDEDDENNDGDINDDDFDDDDDDNDDDVVVVDDGDDYDYDKTQTYATYKLHAYNLETLSVKMSLVVYCWLYPMQL
jgi:hypothetical protein